MKKIISSKRGAEIIERFPKSKVLVVGDIMFDHFIWGRVSRISPEAPVPVVDVRAENFMLGGCANALHNIYSMGGQVYLAGVVGEDDMGAMLLRRFQNMKISTKGVVTESHRPTTIKTRVIAHNQQIVRFDRESCRPISESSIAKIIDYIKTLRNDLGAIVISDYEKGVVTKTLLDEIHHLFSGRGVIICVDPKKKDFSLYHGVDVIKPNHREAEWMLGVNDLNGNEAGKGFEIKRAVKKLLEQLDLKALLITRGEKGMTLFEAGAKLVQTNFATEAKEVFDVSGAGDTAIGVFALAAASGSTFKEAAYLANHAAGIVVGKVGISTVSRKELKKVL
ncbi:MAG: D-glycero-beta-D-manno-heptose-7-phosphate kinase [Deltaproteobacteria bacterium]|nr:D-glycero-beta-D-manno-heptose-7-phosphate kinase [Deltaproteobacteria bacterium]